MNDVSRVSSLWAGALKRLGDTAVTEKLLVVGCGLRPKPGAVNLDCVALPGVNVVMDLNTIDGRVICTNAHLGDVKYAAGAIPFADDYFDRIEAEDVLEHCVRMVDVVNELGRVLKIGGVLWIRGPHWQYPEVLWDDPTHLRAFTPRTFAGWVEGTYDYVHYGHYLRQNGVAFKQLDIRERNRGLEITLERTK